MQRYKSYLYLCGSCGVMVMMGLGTPLIFEFVDQIPPDYLMSISYSFVDIFFITFSFQFAFAAVAVKDRLKILNLKMNSLKNIDENTTNLMIELYQKLFDQMDLINSSFTFQLILMFGYILPSTMFSSYNILRLLSRDSDLKCVLMFTNSIWISAHTFILTVPVYAGHTTTEIAEKVPQIVCRLIQNRSTQNDQIRSNLKMFLRAANCRQINLRTVFFKLNWELIFKVTNKNKNYSMF